MLRFVTTQTTMILKLKVFVKVGYRVLVAVMVNGHVPTFDGTVIVLGSTVIVKKSVEGSVNKSTEGFETKLVIRLMYALEGERVTDYGHLNAIPTLGIMKSIVIGL